MLVIGITGGVGAGKSSVLKALEEQDICLSVLFFRISWKI